MWWLNRKKFGDEVLEKALSIADSAGKETWFALPTEEQDTNVKLYEKAIDQSSIIMGNEAEAVRMFVDKDLKGNPTDQQLQDALAKIQGNFKDSPEFCGRERVAFITNGSKGAYVITAKEIKHVEAKKVKSVNNLGAGDASFGAFMFGVSVGLKYEDAAKFSMSMAASCVQSETSRIENPIASLKEAAKEVGSNILSQLERKANAPREISL